MYRSEVSSGGRIPAGESEETPLTGKKCTKTLSSRLLDICMQN
jgi:hypothetical protein